MRIVSGCLRVKICTPLRAVLALQLQSLVAHEMLHCWGFCITAATAHEVVQHTVCWSDGRPNLRPVQLLCPCRMEQRNPLNQEAETFEALKAAAGA